MVGSLPPNLMSGTALVTLARVGKEFWNKGIASTVVPAFVKWTWNTWSYLVRLEAHTYSTAAASGRVLAKAGFVHEGTHRAAVFKFGQIIDLNTWGLVRPDLS